VTDILKDMISIGKVIKINYSNTCFRFLAKWEYFMFQES